MIRLLFLLLALGLVACDERGPLLPARNECFDDDVCGGRRAYCDRVLLRCVRDKAEEPYPLYVRVTAAAPSGMLADSGVALVPEVVHYLDELTGQRDAEVLRVPSAVSVAGQVAELEAGVVAALLHSQVTIVASNGIIPTAARVIETRPAALGRDGGAPPNLSVPLDPGRHYDVRVQPLSSASSKLPPYTHTDVDSTQPLKLHAPSVEARSGRFVFREASQYVTFARLEERVTGRVLSSTAPVMTVSSPSPSGEVRREGHFTLYAAPEVFTAASNFELVVSLGGFEAWQVTIRIDGERFLAGGDIALPPASAPVKLENVVEDEERHPLANAQIVFVSSYPIPPTSAPVPAPPDDNEMPGTPTAFGADWCRWQDPARISCRGRFQTVSSASGQYSIELVPGLYDVFVIPLSAPRTRNVIVTRHEDPDKPDTPFLVGEATGMLPVTLLLQAHSAPPYMGTIYALNTPAARVTLRALRLPPPSLSSWGTIADFNRTLSVVSDRKGRFSLAPDVGFYDFVFEPELGSALPWKLWLDCPSGPGAGASLAPVELAVPVMVLGSVQFGDGEIRLPNAKIEAFTVVKSENRAPRSVMIGRTVSDERGNYVLALPPAVGEQNGRCKGEVAPVTDSEP